MAESNSVPPESGQVITILPSLTVEESQAVCRYLQRESLKQAQHLFVAGEHSEACYFILNGRLAVKRQADFDKSQVIAVLYPGAPVGEGGLVERGVRSVTVTAVDQVELLKLSATSFEKMMREQPFVAHKITAHLLRTSCLRLEKCSQRLFRVL